MRYPWRCSWQWLRHRPAPGESILFQPFLHPSLSVRMRNGLAGVCLVASRPDFQEKIEPFHGLFYRGVFRETLERLQNGLLVTACRFHRFTRPFRQLVLGLRWRIAHYLRDGAAAMKYPSSFFVLERNRVEAKLALEARCEAGDSGERRCFSCHRLADLRASPFVRRRLSARAYTSRRVACVHALFASSRPGAFAKRRAALLTSAAPWLPAWTAIMMSMSPSGAPLLCGSARASLQ